MGDETGIKEERADLKPMNINVLPKKNAFTFENARCPLCGAIECTLQCDVHRFDQGSLKFVKCRFCETIYQSPRPNRQSMKAFYETQNFFNSQDTGTKFVGYIDYDAEEETRRRNAVYRLTEVERYFPARRKLRILKIACGYGTFVKLAKDSGHEAVGLDGSKVMVEGAKQRYGIDLLHDDFLNHDFGDQKFDCVILYGAINNFIDVADVGRKIFEILAPGGLYFTNFIEPNSLVERLQGSKFWMYRPPVIGFWTVRSFVQAHENTGFRFEETKREIQWVSLGKLVGYLQFSVVLRLLERLNLDQRFVKLPISGYKKVILCRPVDN